MNEPRMPTMLPSAVDGAEFVAVDAWGMAWRCVEEEMVWVRGPEGEPSAADDANPGLTVH